MNKEEIEELMDYNLEYLEARNCEDIFGGDYTSSVDLKYANKEIEQLQQENKQLRERIYKAIEYIEWQEKNPQYDNVWGIWQCKNLIDILKGDSND